MKILVRIDAALAAVERFSVAVLFTGLVLMTFGNIVLRNLFGISSQTMLEMAPAGVLWIALVGASLALRQGRHIRLEIVLRFVSGPVRTAARIATALFGAVVMGILFLASFSFVENEVAIFGSRGWIGVIFPFFFAVSSFRYLLGALTGASQPAAGGKGG